jgi:glycosidase
MKLVLDMVPNHVGPANPWVADEPEPDWFHGTRAHHTEAQGDFAPLVDPHAAWRDQKNTLDGWFANVLPDMNQENPDVAQYLIQNTIWWVEQSGADLLARVPRGAASHLPEAHLRRRSLQCRPEDHLGICRRCDAE